MTDTAPFGVSETLVIVFDAYGIPHVVAESPCAQLIADALNACP